MGLTSVLEQLGLEEKEASVYLALLELGETTATKLSEKTVLDRTLMYQLTTKLVEKGLVSYIIKNNVRYFTAADPDTLLAQLHEKEEQLKSVMPELKARQQLVVPDTKVEVYRGREGIITILKMIVRDGKPYDIFGGAQEACSLFELENTIFVKRMEKLRLRGRIIAREEDTFFIGKNEDYRFVPKELLTSTTQMIWGNKTAIFVWSQPYYAIVIDQKEITQSNRAHFEYVWKNAKVPSGKDKKNRQNSI